MLSLVAAACSPSDSFGIPASLNSRYIDEQPALSGNGRFLAFVSNRDGRHHIWLYDLQQQRLISLPRLNRPDTVAESPSLSYTGRYITYITSEQGKPTLVLYDRATQQPQVLSQGYQGWVRNPNISPDGRYIVFESSSHGQWDIEVLDRGPNIERDIPDGAPVGSTSSPSP
jgi:Tol biopolymer transport system component